MQTDVTLTKRSVDLCIRLGLKGKVIHAYFEQKERERERESDPSDSLSRLCIHMGSSGMSTNKIYMCEIYTNKRNIYIIYGIIVTLHIH